MPHAVLRSAAASLAIAILAPGCVGAEEPIDEGQIARDESQYFWLGSDPQAWRRFWYAKHARNIGAPIEPAQPQAPHSSSRTVLLVPGTTIGTEFFQPMAARLRRDGFDVVVWAPPDLFTESLARGAARIGDQVDAVLASRSKTKLHLVAECDGGVAARYYAQVLGGNAKLDQLVTFVSAHNGSQAAPTGAWFTGWQALRDIKPNSAFLTKLNSTPMPAGMKLTSIYSCADEYLWPYSTSRVPGATNVEFCSRYVGHFDGFWDAVVYTRIRATLRGEGDAAPRWY